MLNQYRKQYRKLYRKQYRKQYRAAVIYFQNFRAART